MHIKIVMKFNCLLILLLGFSFSSLSAQDASQIVSWKSKTIALGAIKKGDKVANSYSFTNVSDHPIEIDIVSTCECTEAKWTQGKIAPGDKGEINFIFDSNLKDHEEAIDVDVYFLDTDPKTERPYSSFLSYTFQFSK